LSGTGLEGITGRLGIGAITVLGLFLLVDGAQIGVFELIETYGNSTTWGIVGIVPTAVVTYIVGVFCLGAADLVLSKLSAFQPPTPADVLNISRTGSALLEQAYSDHTRNFELLKGAAISFVILSVGSLAEASNLPSNRSVIWLAVLAALGLSPLSLLFAHRSLVQARDLARIAGDDRRPMNGTQDFTVRKTGAGDPT